MPHLKRGDRFAGFTAGAGLLALSCLTGFHLAAADFYVATNGSDANPGTFAAPFQSLTQAQSVVRAALPSATGPINVRVRGGIYYLGQALAFGPQDSGSSTVPVTYCAYTNETVTLSGALRLTPAWTPYSGNTNIRVANIGANLDIDGLFVNDAQQVLARYPDYNPNTVILAGYASDCLSSNRASRWSNPTTGLVRGLHGNTWGGNSFTITGKDSGGIPILQWVGDNNRGGTLHATYRMVENLFEELDTTNEWFYNKTTGNLYYYPPAGLNLAAARVEAAVLSELVGFRGAATNQTVSHITLSNFIFTQTHRTLFNTPYEGLMRGDWAVARAGTIFMSNADYITIQNSVFTNVGGNAIFMSAHNRTNIVNNNVLANVGATGVQVAGLMSATRYPSTWSNQHTDILDTVAGPLTDDYPMGVIVSSNHMYNLGVFEKQSAGVSISVADSITVSHNTIHTSPRSGINVNDGCFGGDIIEFNDVWDCVRETSDHGPFNSWNRDRFYSYLGVNTSGANGTAKRPYAFLDHVKPTHIRNNRFQYSTVQTWGIDLDDGSSNYQIYNNVCLNTGFKLREGFSRHVYNNIIINQCGNLQVWYDTCQDQVDHNLVVNGSPWALVSLNSGNLPAKQAVIDTNFFWNSGGSVTLPFSGWTNLGFDVHSLTVNPQFSNVAANDYTVNSAAILAAGFTNIPMDQFGTTQPGTPTPPAITIAVPPAPSGDPEPLMGATITSIYSSDIEGLTGLPDTNGVYVQTVPAGSYAASQGFMANDVIRQINGINVTSKQSFWTNYTVIAPGSLVSLVLWRNAAIQSFNIFKMGGPEQLNETAGTLFHGAGWQVQVNVNCYNNDIRYTTVNGDDFQFSFNGTGIKFLSEMHTDQDQVNVYIDGAFDQTISCYRASGRLYQQVVYTNQGLSPGIHTIKGIKNNSSYMILDAFIVLQPAAPAAPANLTATALSDSQIHLTWVDNATNETAYVVQRSPYGANVWTTLTSTLPADSTDYTDTGLTTATSYDYRICCLGAGGPSTYATITAATLPGAGANLTWQGDGSANNWDIQSTANWLNGGGLGVFHQGDNALFDDSGSNSPAINLATTLSPGSVTVDAAQNYVFSGEGQMSGGMSLTKRGSGTLTLNTTNTFTGGVNLTGGTLKAGNASALGTAGGITVVTNGGTLDVNGFNLTAEPVVVSGTGFNANGAIVNGGAIQGSALRQVTLAGDVTFGGTNRWDIRNTGGSASLNTSPAGSAYKITKMGSNQVSLVAVTTIDSALGDIDIQQGSFAIQTSTTQMGNPTNTIIVHSNATLNFYTLSTALNKKVLMQDGSIVFNERGPSWVAGPITIQGLASFNVAGNGTPPTLTVSNAISGPGSLSKVGTGTLVLTGTNIYAGSTSVSAGTLALAGSGSISGSSNITIAANATLDASGRADHTLTLAGGQTLQGNGAVNASLTVGSNATLSPGSSIGILTVTNGVTLQGTTFMELDKGNGTNDAIAGAATINFGGTVGSPGTELEFAL